MPELRVPPLAVMLLFAALFGGLGWAILGGGVLKLRKMRIEEALVAAYPNEPWRHRVELAARGLVDLARPIWNSKRCPAVKVAISAGVSSHR